jgi:hypothetical protein
LCNEIFTIDILKFPLRTAKVAPMHPAPSVSNRPQPQFSCGFSGADFPPGLPAPFELEPAAGRWGSPGGTLFFNRCLTERRISPPQPCRHDFWISNQWGVGTRCRELGNFRRHLFPANATSCGRSLPIAPAKPANR